MQVRPRTPEERLRAICPIRLEPGVALILSVSFRISSLSLLLVTHSTDGR